MTISQSFYKRTEEKYDDDISISDIPKGHFPAMVASKAPPEGEGSTRLVRIELLPLEQAPGGTMDLNTGAYYRRPWEMDVTIQVFLDGKELASQTQAYATATP